MLIIYQLKYDVDPSSIGEAAQLCRFGYAVRITSSQVKGFTYNLRVYKMCLPLTNQLLDQ